MILDKSLGKCSSKFCLISSITSAESSTQSIDSTNYYDHAKNIRETLTQSIGVKLRGGVGVFSMSVK